MMPPAEGSGSLSTEVLSQVFDASPSAMLLVADDGRIHLANTQAERLFGYRSGELAGLPIERLVPEHFRAGHGAKRGGYFAAPLARAMGEGRDLNALRRDGTEVPVEIGLNPISTERGLLVLAAIIDISQRRRSEDTLRASLEEKETLLREVHHRVKNNMQVVSSLLNLQSASVDDPKQRELLDECHTRVRAMALVHEQLYATANLAELDGRGYVHELTNLLFASYHPANCRVQLQLDVAPWPLDLETAIPVGLILHEWITNALKHAFVDRAHGALRVASRPLATGERELVVADDGRGMPPGFVPERSPGLGFRMVHSLIRQVDGTLTIAATAGTTLTLTFHGAARR
ncbi:MAG: PAS domain S-box protein [Planctomycetes bacterium]|nr:PAS domain S-box protein [Planctomycetota bacterium]